jgi:hypothetical protein
LLLLLSRSRLEGVVKGRLVDVNCGVSEYLVDLFDARLQDEEVLGPLSVYLHLLAQLLDFFPQLLDLQLILCYNLLRFPALPTSTSCSSFRLALGSGVCGACVVGIGDGCCEFAEGVVDEVADAALLLGQLALALRPVQPPVWANVREVGQWVSYLRQ